MEEELVKDKLWLAGLAWKSSAKPNYSKEKLMQDDLE